jgi:hypothetical protein
LTLGGRVCHIERVEGGTTPKLSQTQKHKMKNISELAANGNNLDLALAEVRGEVKVTRLATKKAPKTGRRARNGRAVTSGVEVNGIAVGKGRMGNLNRVGGIGKEMIANVSGAVANYEAVVKANRREEARLRAAEKAAEREANALENLDSLLDEVQA